jgi:ligand-binding sensor domain-containing protein
MPQIVLAGTTAGVYSSEDDGQTWQPVGHDRLDMTVTALARGAAQAGSIYAGTEHAGLFRSADGGRHWQQWGLENRSVYAILADRTGTLWVGTEQGVFRSR